MKMEIIGSAYKTGDSLVMTIPAEVAQKMKITAGQRVRAIIERIE